MTIQLSWVVRRFPCDASITTPRDVCVWKRKVVKQGIAYVDLIVLTEKNYISISMHIKERWVLFMLS